MLAVVGKWLARQALATAVVMAGIVAGWWVRKWTGPTVLSETFAAQPARARGPGAKPVPQPLGDPAARAWRAELASLDSPSQTLLRLQRDLAAGAITHFEALARDLLSHPLPQFRAEALQAVLAAWGDKDPAGLLRFIDEINANELALAGFKKPFEFLNHVMQRWAAANPEAALDYYAKDLQGGKTNSRMFLTAMLSRGDLAENLALLEKKMGASWLASHLSYDSIIRDKPGSGEASGKQSNKLSADGWRELARNTSSPVLARTYAAFALQMLQDQKTLAGQTASIADMEAWLGDAGLIKTMGRDVWNFATPSDAAERLQQLSPQEIAADRSASLKLAWIIEDEPAKAMQIAGAFGEHQLPQGFFGRLGRGLHAASPEEVAQAFALAARHGQQDQLAGSLAEAWTKSRGAKDSLDPIWQTIGALGDDGEPLFAATLANLKGNSARQVPEFFALQTPEFQSEHRLEVVSGLASHSPQAAAEIWRHATPEELAQPGVSVVAEEIAAHFLRRDSEAASAWIGQLPPGVSRDLAVARMIEQTASADPETCAQWVATIDDPAARSRAEAALAGASATPAPQKPGKPRR